MSVFHLRRTENSTFAAQDGQVSISSYPSFLMYMYNIIWIISLSLLEKFNCMLLLKLWILFAKLISKLGSTNSGSNNVRLKPFSATIFKFFIWIIATITKICTKEYFNQDHSQFFSHSSQTFTRSNINLLWRSCIAHPFNSKIWTVEYRLRRLERYQFSGLIH